MIGKFTDELVQKIIFELKKEETQEQFRTHLLDPAICYVMDRLYPYIFITSAIFILLLLVAISILFLIIKTNYL